LQPEPGLLGLTTTRPARPFPAGRVFHIPRRYDVGMLENWPIKLAIVVILGFVAVGAYYGIKAGEHMALSKQMIPILTEKYRAPTEDAWRKAHAELGIEYTEGHRFNTEQLKQYIAKWEAEKQQKQTGQPGGSSSSQ
jgi:hypothetical protein